MLFFLLVLLFFLLFSIPTSISLYDPGFVYEGFRDAANLSREGLADITPNGLLRLTNNTRQGVGRAFYSYPLQFKNTSSLPFGAAAGGNSTTSKTISTVSFSSTFVFAVVSEYPDISGHGITFVLSPQRDLAESLPSYFYLGIFNASTVGKSTNHVFAVELDTFYNIETDINNNHVGVDINDLNSVKSSPAMYFDSKFNGFRNLSLISGERMQVWVDYDGISKQLNVTIAPIIIPKPDIPLLSLPLDLSTIILNSMYVGFSSATGSILTSHYILGWSFKINGETQALELSQLPKLPPRERKKHLKILQIGLPVVVPVIVLVIIFGVFFIIRWKKKFAELVEDWELNNGAKRFSYKDLYNATKGFREKEILGFGGFGRVYRGLLPTSKIEVAIKRVSHDSRQGVRQFIAEIASIGQLRHRNLVQLLGYSRRKQELLLVYDYMPNGSLDKFLFGGFNSSSSLNWDQRFRIIKGVARGLTYLHEEWEKTVIHRDIKASNILLDREMNARLGDFGLARLVDHETNPQTTSVVGTLGYLAPELTRTGKATTSTDVFAFGALLLEVACGRRPIEASKSDTEEGLVLVDWVFSCWSRGVIVETSDPKLGGEYVVEEMELVLKLGLLCSHNLEKARPTMRQVVHYLERDSQVPEIELCAFDMTTSISVNLGRGGNYEDIGSSYTCYVDKTSILSSPSIAGSVLSEGR